MPHRLAHRPASGVLTNYFQHIMQLPLTFHTGAAFRRLMKVMLNGTSLWRWGSGFFREHFAAIMSLLCCCLASPQLAAGVLLFRAVAWCHRC